MSLKRAWLVIVIEQCSCAFYINRYACPQQSKGGIIHLYHIHIHLRTNCSWHYPHKSDIYIQKAKEVMPGIMQIFINKSL